MKSLKDSERKQAAFRVWAKLQGPAKAVVKHLNPDDYESEEGLSKLLEVRRTSPLQQLPVPDSFKRLDVWHHLRRNNGESIPQLLVREEDLFVQLQSALMRARQDRAAPGLSVQHLSGLSRDVPRNDLPRNDPPSTPSRSPVGGGGRGVPAASEASTQPMIPPPPPVLSDFFEDELRGYRLLKAASSQEKQNVLTQTSNSTNFLAVRRALRTLFSEDEDNSQAHWRKPRIWWNEGDEPYYEEEDAQWQDWESIDPGQADRYEAYWNDWAQWEEDGWEEGYDESWYEGSPHDDVPIDESAQEPTEIQYKEAYALANEATKTLAEARDAVRRVRQARGYFAPESMSGKGFSKSRSPSGSPKGKSGSSGGKSLGGKGKSFGPCFICGLNGHSWAGEIAPTDLRREKVKVRSSRVKVRATRGIARASQFSIMTSVHALILECILWMLPLELESSLTPVPLRMRLE